MKVHRRKEASFEEQTVDDDSSDEDVDVRGVNAVKKASKRRWFRQTLLVAAVCSICFVFLASRQIPQSSSNFEAALPSSVATTSVTTSFEEDNDNSWTEDTSEGSDEERIEEKDGKSLSMQDRLKDFEESKAASPREKQRVCIKAPNLRVASIFARNFLDEFDDTVEYVLSPQLSAQIPPFIASGSISPDASLASTDPSCTWPVVNLVFQNAFSAPASIPKGTVIVVGDEYCRCPMNICSPTGRAAMRQYASSTYKIPYLPLGPRVEFEPVPSMEKQPSSERKIPFNFMGAATSPSRKLIASLVSSQQVKEAYPFFENALVQIAPKWKKNVTADGYLQPAEYRRILLDSVFTLCPAGHNPEAFRIFEAVEAGSIPVIALDKAYETHGCKGAFQPLIDSGAPFIVLKSWDQFPAKLAELLASPEKLNDIQDRMVEWRTQFWSDVAATLKSIVYSSTSSSTNSRLAIKNGKRASVATSLSSAGSSSTSAVPVSKKQPTVNKPSRPLPKFANPNKTPLITGCGRSGTHSLASFLTSIGIPSLHEGFRPGWVSVSWLYAADSDEYPFEGKVASSLRRNAISQLESGGLDGRGSLFGPVVQLTRHPLKVISSTRRCFCGKGDRSRPQGAKSDRKSWRFVEKAIPRMEPISPFSDIRRSAIYWLEWNKMIEDKYPDRTHLRLEDLDPVKLVEALGVVDFDMSKVPKEVSRNSFHTSPQKSKDQIPDTTWADLHSADEGLAREVFFLAQHYGYEKDSSYEQVVAQAQQKEENSDGDDDPVFASPFAT